MERPDVISLREILPRLDGNFTSRNLVHTNKDNAHQANVRVLGLNEDQATGRRGGEVTLGAIGRGGIRTSDALETVFRVITPRHDVSFHNSTTDGAVPLMIGHRLRKACYTVRRSRTRGRRWLTCRGWSKAGL